MARLTVRTVGIIGLGAFGRMVAQALAPYAIVRGYDPCAGGDDLPDVAGCDVVVLAVPVSEVAVVCRQIAPLLRVGAVVVDVGSVKVRPVAAMLQDLPDHVDIIGTHPLFGPQSAGDGLSGHRIAVCPVRGRAGRVAAFLRHALGLNVILTTPDQHDAEMAHVQGLTHLIAQALIAMEQEPIALTTPSFDLMRRAVDMVRDDSPAVWHAIADQNPHAQDVRNRFRDLLEQACAT